MKKPKLPKFALFAGRPKKLQATMASRRAPAADNYYEEEPKTNLSSAFIVVLVLHIVAVGGIYAFNSLRASRSGSGLPAGNTSAPALGTPLASKPGALAPDITPSKSAPAPATASKSNVYHVKSGDTLTKIATLHGVAVSDLEEANGIKMGSVLKLNQGLTIPAVKAAPMQTSPSVVQDPRKSAFLASKGESAPAVHATTNSATRSYTVAKGDTPTSIAKKFGMSSDDLMKLNKIDDPKKMKLGQTLKVSAKKN